MDIGELTRRVRALEKEHRHREVPGVDQAGVVLFDVPVQVQTSVLNKEAGEVKTVTTRSIFDNQARSNERRLLYDQIQTTATAATPTGESAPSLRVRSYVAQPGGTNFIEADRTELWSTGEIARYVQGHTVPLGNNKFSLGLANSKWTQVYATNGSINTSDERWKTDIAPIPDAVLDAWGDVAFVQFRMLEAVQTKCEAARLHAGLVAQRIRDVFEAHGLDAFRYGLLCYDAWKETSQLVDQNGDVVEQAHPAGDVYSLRYEECLCMEAAYQRRRVHRLEERLAELEAQITGAAETAVYTPGAV